MKSRYDTAVVSQVEKGQHRCSFVHTIPGMYTSCVRFGACCTVAVGMSVYYTVFRGSEGAWVVIVQIVFRMTHKHGHTHTHKNTVRGCHKGNTLTFEMRLPLHHGCRNVHAELGGRGDTYTAASSNRQHSKNKEAEIEPHSVSIVPTACCKILGWHALPQASTVHV